MANDGEGLITSQNSDRLLDRYVLAVLYYATNGGEWFNGYSFLSPDPTCEWKDTTFAIDRGVTCNDNNEVVELIIKEFGLQFQSTNL